MVAVRCLFACLLVCCAALICAPCAVRQLTTSYQLVSSFYFAALLTAALCLPAPTGTGKTLCFALPLLSRLTPQKSLQGVVLLPTRELVLQVTWVLRKLSKGRDIFVMPVLEGSSRQRNKGWLLSDPPAIIVGTATEVTQLLRGEGWSEKVHTVIVDEVDECVRRATEDLSRILGRTLSESFVGNRAGNVQRLTLFTSATIGDRRHFLKDVVKNGWTGGATECGYIEFSGSSSPRDDPGSVIEREGRVMPANLRHKYVVVNENAEKLKILRKWLVKKVKKNAVGAMIVFAREEQSLSRIAAVISKDLGGIVWSEQSNCQNDEGEEGLLQAKVVVCVLREGGTLRERQGALEVFKGELERRRRRMTRKKQGWGMTTDTTKEAGEAKSPFADVAEMEMEMEMEMRADVEEELGSDQAQQLDESYRGSTMRILVCTDGTAARGMDVTDCHTVFNLDLPATGTSYVHRGGRAGRFGRKGEVCSVARKAEEFVVKKIGNEVGVDIECVGKMARKKSRGNS